MPKCLAAVVLNLTTLYHGSGDGIGEMMRLEWKKGARIRVGRVHSFSDCRLVQERHGIREVH